MRLDSFAIGRYAGVLLSALLAAGPLTGCVPVVLAGAGTGAVVVAQERSPGDAIDDTVIRAEINRLWLAENAGMYRGLNLNVQEGRVLITGAVKTPQQRIDAVRLAWQVDGVREVHEEVQLGDGGGVGGYATDSYIATTLRGALTLDPDIRSINFSIEVENRVVYLIGIARDQQELNRVVDHARNIGLVSRVVSYVRLRGAPVGQNPPGGGGS